MRNINEFPITCDEIIDCLERLMVEARELGDEQCAVGDMTTLLLHRAIQIIKRERFLHGG